MPSPIYAGAERAIVRLASGEYVCVDTRSIDAIDYLLGWPMEMDFLPAFRRFLRPGSVVLDIGANFGLYTAAAASFVKDCGRLYAFEANPHTFAVLRRTLYANRLSHNPNIVAVNALVGEVSGRGTLYYSPEALGGASATDIGQWGAEGRSVEVERIAIDDFLPPDLPVDLVKIDVEGHEPYVLRGMRRTIRRSPRIRIFLEFFDGFLAHTTGADRFVAEIAESGLHLCEIVPGARIARLPPGQPVRGAHFCFLTRTPEEDIAHARRQSRRLLVRFATGLRRAGARWDRRRHALYRL
ncbi:MAG: FkbM family methyltransferase [Stellaceae bacterium]